MKLSGCPAWLRLGLAMVIAGAVGLGAGTAQAAWNGQLYNPGATLDPECNPGTTNCDVRPPANSGNNTNITQMSGLVVPLRTDQGGTGLSSSVAAGALLVGDGGTTLTCCRREQRGKF